MLYSKEIMCLWIQAHSSLIGAPVWLVPTLANEAVQQNDWSGTQPVVVSALWPLEQASVTNRGIHWEEIKPQREMGNLPRCDTSCMDLYYS